MSKPILVLASASPRRSKLLEQIGVNFIVDVADVDESLDSSGLPPSEIVERLAVMKGNEVADRHPDRLVLSADTIVVLDGKRLGKPRDEKEAVEMLMWLSDRTHQVYTGISLIHKQSDRSITASEVTRVTFSSLTDSEIRAYVASGSPMDKAGAYGIQDDRGAVFVSRIEGDYYNVVGLPLNRLYRLITTDFYDLRIF